MIIFTNASFDRGTDSLCLDHEITQAGGIHVLFTYFPDGQSDLLQSKSKTALPGNISSFSIILLQSDLEKFQIQNEEEITSHDNELYKFIREKRKTFFKS